MLLYQIMILKILRLSECLQKKILLEQVFSKNLFCDFWKQLHKSHELEPARISSHVVVLSTLIYFLIFMLTNVKLPNESNKKIMVQVS